MVERIPELLADLTPPRIYGTAELTHLAFAGATADQLLELVDRQAATLEESAAHALDCSIVSQLAFHSERGLAMQAAALSLCQLYRVAGQHAPVASPLRLLAVMEPGDLMANAPLDFITRWTGVRLDLLYLLPGRPMPLAIPDHDVAYFGGGNDGGSAAALQRRAELFRAWPRPVLNDPACNGQLGRAELALALMGIPGLCSPACLRLPRTMVQAGLDVAYPLLLRPVGSHAGKGLAKLDDAAGVASYAAAEVAEEYYVTRFEDYRSPDGQFRKYRIAFIDGAPFLCHMGVSADWMIHYLNAGMTGSEDKRADEAQAMAEFDDGFARRHAQAFAALNARLGLDYFTIDCGETQDGRLLVFEADCEAIIHLMDPPDLFPYKAPQMQRVFAAFMAMLHRHATSPAPLAALAA